MWVGGEALTTITGQVGLRFASSVVEVWGALAPSLETPELGQAGDQGAHRLAQV